MHAGDHDQERSRQPKALCTPATAPSPWAQDPVDVVWLDESEADAYGDLVAQVDSAQDPSRRGMVRCRYEPDPERAAAPCQALAQTDRLAGQLAQLVHKDDQRRLLRRRPPLPSSMGRQEPGAGVDDAVGRPQDRGALIGADSPTVEHPLPGSQLEAVATVDTPQDHVAPGRQLRGYDIHHP